MKLKRLDYNQFINDSVNNYWGLKNLYLDRLNLIVGKNAVGKTMTTSVIYNLAQLINFQINEKIKNGNWKAEFETNDGKVLDFELTLVGGKVVHERVLVDKVDKLNRDNSKTVVYSEVHKKYEEIEPPDDKLVMQIRRDKKEYSFFEYLYDWASSTFGYRFGKYDPATIRVAEDNKYLLNSLDTAPSVLEKMSADSLTKVINDFNGIGYELESVGLGVEPGMPFNLKLIMLKEKGLKFPFNQTIASSGMLRAFALLLVMQYILDEKKNGFNTIIIDDLGEGLDFDRSTKLAQLIFKKMNRENIQFIATTNDRFLINAVDIKFWNILIRNYDKVEAFNYANSKELFNKFKLTGLSNFDLFSSNYLTKK